MPTTVPLLTSEQIARLPERAREVIEYRKSGLSLNHIQGCPLDCAYCIRHTYGVWDIRQPRALMSDADAVQALVDHGFFQPHRTPIQIFNRATDPFLPRVKQHLFTVLEDLDARGLTNHVLVITRYRIDPEDCQRLNRLRNLKLTLLITYSGIADRRIEPVNSEIAARSLRVAHQHARRYRVILYWRPLVPGLNDTDEHLARAVELSQHARHRVHRAVLSRRDRRLLPRQRAARALRQHRPPQDRSRDPGTTGARHFPQRSRRPAVPQDQLRRVVRPRGARLQRPLRYTRDVRHLPRQTAQALRQRPSRSEQGRAAGIGCANVGREGVRDRGHSDRAAILAGLDEQPRYYLQHGLGFQIHDERHPHRHRLHGRADIGWNEQSA